MTEKFFMALRKNAILFSSSFRLDHHVPEMRHMHGRKLWFDISEIGNDVSLMMAELRLYQNSLFSKYDEEKQVTVRLYKADIRNE